MNIVGRVSVNMKPVNQIIKRLGLNKNGAVQRFHTQNVKRRIQKYMPYRTGATIKKMIIDSPVNLPYIHIKVPYARYLYYGKAMEGKPPKTVTDRDLIYSTHKNKQAGAFWDRRLKAAEGAAMQRELQNYVNRRAGR